MRYESEIANRARQIGTYIVVPWNRGIKEWCENFIAHYDGTETVLLMPARTDTQWFRLITSFCGFFLSVSHRLKFGDAKGCAPFPSMVLYKGNNQAGFEKAFSDIGTLYYRTKVETA